MFATHPGRFWFGFTLAVVPLVIGPVGRASGGAPDANSQHLCPRQDGAGEFPIGDEILEVEFQTPTWTARGSIKLDGEHELAKQSCIQAGRGC